MAYIEAKDYRYRYAGADKPALAIDSLEIGKGELVLVIGPSGCGKTTLLRRLAEESGYRGEEEGKLIREDVSFGYVWQDPGAQMVCHRVEAEIVFGMENRGFSRQDMERRLAEVVTFFGLEHLVHREVTDLSAGEKQTVNIAGAIAGLPELLLLDEPTSALDPMAAEQLAGLIRKIHRELGMTVFVTEQRPEHFYEIADRILVMEEGRIVCDGDYKTFLSSGVGREFLPVSVKNALKEGAVPEEVMSIRSRRDWWRKHPERVDVVSENYRKIKTKGTKSPIRLKNVSYTYHRKEPDVLRECSMELSEGITALVGGNGSGKTTLAEVVAGVRRSYRGKVTGLPKSAYLPAEPGYLFVEETFDGSGGEREWYGIDLVLSREAELYILDEPTKGLDPGKKEELRTRLKEVCDRGRKVLLVTHDVEFAAAVADTMAMMYDGRIVACGETQEFLKGNAFYTTELQRLLSRG